MTGACPHARSKPPARFLRRGLLVFSFGSAAGPGGRFFFLHRKMLDDIVPHGLGGRGDRVVFMAEQVDGADELPFLVGNGQHGHLIRLHGRYIGQHRYPEPKAHILEGGVAFPYLKNDLGDNIPLGKDLIHGAAQVAAVFQHDLGLPTELLKTHRAARGSPAGVDHGG